MPSIIRGLLLGFGLVSAAGAEDAAAGRPTEVGVTVYRAPGRLSGSIQLDALDGFALISETRLVHVAAGVTRLRFEGVADGIEPASAIVTGLPGMVIEKDREGKLLSPSALLGAAVGKPVALLRTDRSSGRLRRIPVVIRSTAGDGVVVESAEGIEALRCSGLPETLSVEAASDLAATPALSVLVRSAVEVTKTVTLSYLARGFDWSADYVATVADDGKSMDLGAWVTLANGNGVGFPEAHTQVVAGRLDRGSGEVLPLDSGGPIIARCWPRGSTSDTVPQLLEDRMFKRSVATSQLAAPAASQEVMVSARRVEEEQLGDLKLYRVPEATTVASRQSKQVRLLDRSAIPIDVVYTADLPAEEDSPPTYATRLLRTRNSRENHLGLALPSGRVAVFSLRGGATLLQHESGMRDLAVDEELELDLGQSPDVRVAVTREHAAASGAGVSSSRVEVSNARGSEVEVELRLRLPDGRRVVRADHAVGDKNGRPIFRLSIPPNDAVTLRYQTQRAG
jgi:hypothetical protein